MPSPEINNTCIVIESSPVTYVVDITTASNITTTSSVTKNAIDVTIQEDEEIVVKLLSKNLDITLEQFLQLELIYMV